MAAGNRAGAHEVIPRCSRHRIPEPTRADGWLIRLWEEVRSPLAQGAQMDLIRLRGAAVGLTSTAAQLEVWERVCIVESAVREYMAAVQKARA